MEARNTIRTLLDNQSIPFGQSECTVRVNSVQSGLMEEDLKIILGSSKNLPSSIHLPKVDSVQELKYFVETADNILSSSGWDKSKDKLNLIIFIESAKGMLSLPQICQTAWDLSDKSFLVPDALIFGSDDYCADIGKNMHAFFTTFDNHLHT